MNERTQVILSLIIFAALMVLINIKTSGFGRVVSYCLMWAAIAAAGFIATKFAISVIVG